MYGYVLSGYLWSAGVQNDSLGGILWLENAMLLWLIYVRMSTTYSNYCEPSLLYKTTKKYSTIDYSHLSLQQVENAFSVLEWSQINYLNCDVLYWPTEKL